MYAMYAMYACNILVVDWIAREGERKSESHNHTTPTCSTYSNTHTNTLHTSGSRTWEELLVVLVVVAAPAFPNHNIDFVD